MYHIYLEVTPQTPVITTSAVVEIQMLDTLCLKNFFTEGKLSKSNTVLCLKGTT